MENNLDNDNEQGAVFALDLPDNDLLDLLRKPFEESRKHWDATLNKVRQENMDLWLPNHWKDHDVYDYQEDYLYQDNRIFTSTETILAVVNARIAQPEVMPGQDTIASIQMAKDLSKTLYAHSEKFQTPDLFRLAVRNLLLKRVGFIKLRWDPNYGKFGEIVPEHVIPEDIIVDKDAKLGDVPRFIGHIIKNKTGEELLGLFPDAEQKIFECLGVQRRNRKGDLVAYKSQLAQKKNIIEIWFRYLNEENGRYEGGVAWVDENFQYVFDSQKNPNWNYEEVMTEMTEKLEPNTSESNLLDFPEPPIIPINYLNDGTSWIDQTTMVEQAAPLQRVLNKRGFQIMENAEQAGSGIVFNTQMITKEDIAKLVGSPDERVGVKGDVRSAFVRIPPPPLPSYVIEDKFDARNEIDNIFATHDVTRGEKSDNVTLGQDQLQVGQDYNRMQDIARAVERMATKYYRYLVQMMKVYYTEEHYFRAVGEDGQFDFVVMKQDFIEDGIDISVQAGSTMPVEKDRQLKTVTDLAQMGLLDPLTIYEVATGGNLPSPKKMLERFMLYKTDPLTFMGKAREDEFNRYAFMDIQILLRGTIPKQRPEYDPTYFKYFNEFMVSGDFLKQVPLVKQLFAEHLKIATGVAKAQLVALMTQMPTKDEMDAKNEETAKQAELDARIQGGAVGPNIPGRSTTTADKQPSPADKAKQDPIDRAVQQEQAPTPQA